MLLIILFSFYTLVNGMERVYLSKFITPGSDVTNQTYVTRDMSSMLTCIENCKLRKSCKFVNYEVRTKVCTLNICSSPNIDNVTLTLRRGFVCAVKSDWDMVRKTYSINVIIESGSVSPSIPKNVICLVLQIFLYLEAFECNASSDWLNRPV